MSKTFVMTMTAAACLTLSAAACGSSADPGCKRFTEAAAKCNDLSDDIVAQSVQGCSAVASNPGCEAALMAAAKCMQGASCDEVNASSGPCDGAYSDVSTLCYGDSAAGSTLINPNTTLQDPNTPPQDPNGASKAVAAKETLHGIIKKFLITAL